MILDYAIGAEPRFLRCGPINIQRNEEGTEGTDVMFGKSQLRV